MKKIIKVFNPIIWFFVRIYWFIFRPSGYGVKVVITCGNDILFVRHAYGYKTWTFPGGSIKNGEKKEDAIKREVKEEVGINLSQVSFLGHFVSTKEYKKDNIFVYCSKVESKDFKKDDFEIEEVRWFNINNTPELPKNSRIMLNFYRNEKY